MTEPGVDGAALRAQASTGVADAGQSALKVVSERHYEAGPPSNLDQQQLVDPDGAVATTKEEEWVTKKKTELTTTRQIETRVKRQVLVEDGKVVEDSGPIVTTNTTEDTEKQESHHTEKRKPGEEGDPPDGEWTLATGPGGLVKEVKEKVVKSREQKEERIETENVVHLGDLAEEDYVTAIRNKQDVRQLLLEKAEGKGGELVSLKDTSRVLHQSSKSHKTIDTKDSHKISAVGPDGRVITETKTTTEHEEVRDQEDPDDEVDAVDGAEEEVHETKNESSHHFHKSRDQELVEYLADGVKIGEEMRYQAENVEGERQGDPDTEWDSLSTRIRRMRRQGQRGLGPTAAAGASTATPLDRKDALTRRPLDFDQEEETRKVETSKWLEHHFGSDSRSSKDSLGDEDEPPAPAAKTSFINVTMKSRPITSPVVNGVGPSSPPSGYVATTVNTSSRVFVSSPESDEPPAPTNGYFKGVSDWSERRNEPRAVFSSTPHRPERVQVLPTGPNHTFKPREEVLLRSPHGSSDHVDRGASPGHVRTAVYHTNSNTSTERCSSQQRVSPFHVHDRLSPPHRDSPTRVQAFPYNGTSRDDDDGYPAPPRRRYADRVERAEEEAFTQDDYRSHWEQARSRPGDQEPPPDYSPPPAASPSPSPPPHEPPASKKVYQRTRFAADIPPVAVSPPPPPPPKATPTNKGSFIGDSFRRLVGRLRSSSAERKARKKNRSPSPLQQSSTYQQYHVIDSNVPGVAPPPPRPARHHQSSSQHGRERTSAACRRSPEEDDPRQTPDAMDRGQQRGGRVVQKYYLGEDPFGGSIYGREREYDGVVPARSRRHRQHSGGSREEVAVNRVSSSTLGRLSKSTSRLVGDSPAPLAPDSDVDYTRSAQTLPRKLLYEKRQQQQSSQWQHRTSSPGLAKSPHSSSLINVSIINNVTPPPPASGPAKPARTYRSSLARSKSFNVHAGGDPAATSVHKSNPQLHRLDESPPPLKSPGILASISRSQRDLTVDVDDKKRVFMRGLHDRAPELFRTLHGDEDLPPEEPRSSRLFSSTPLKNGYSSGSPLKNGYSTNSRHVDYSESFRSSSTNATPPDGDAYRRSSPFRQSVVNGGDRVVSPSYVNGGGSTSRSVVRKGSPNADDYSETVRITSKSEDPARPSVTNTVQSFSKKTVPTKGGRSTETIESSETTTVTKSRIRAGDPVRYQENGFGKYGGLRNGTGGVVIEVRPSRK